MRSPSKRTGYRRKAALLYNLSFRGKLMMSTTVLLLAVFLLPVMVQEVVVGREVVEVVEGERGKERTPSFDNSVLHTGRGFSPFRNLPYLTDPNDGRLHGSAVELHTGSFTFNTFFTDYLNLGLDVIPGVVGLDRYYDREKLQERLAKLAGGVAVINVGAATEAANFRLGFKYDSQAGSPDGSGAAYRTPVGNGWTHNYYCSAKRGIGGEILVTRGTRTDAYQPAGAGRFTNATGFYCEVFELPDGTLELHWPNQTVEVYRAEDGALVEIRNKSGQRLRLQYNSLGLLETVVDALGREIAWSYDADSSLLKTITDFTGRTVTLEHDADGNLTAITGPAITGTPNGNDFPLGKTIRFEYFGGSDPRLRNNLVGIFAPNEAGRSRGVGGGGRVAVTYDTSTFSLDFDRVRTLTVGGTNATGVPAGGTITYSYQDLSASDPQTNTPVFRTTVVDRNGNQTEYELNLLGNIVEMHELTKGLRLGEPPFFRTSYKYNADGEMIEKTLPEGNVHIWTYDTTNPDRAAHGNMIEYTRLPDGRGDQAALVREIMYEPIYQQPCLVVEERGNDPRFTPQNGGATSPERYTTRWRFDYQEGNDVAALAAIRSRPEAFIQERLDAMAAEIPMGLGDINGDGITTQNQGNAIQKIFPSPILPDGSLQTITEEYQFNDFGQKIAEIDGEGNLDTYEYHPAPTYQATGLGYLFRITRDAAPTRKRTETAPPAVITEEFTYDLVGNWITHRDGRGNIDTRDVNQLNQVVRTVTEGPFFYERLYFYDANNNVVERWVQNKDGNNQIATPEFFIHRYKYDIQDNRVEGKLDAMGSTPNWLVIQTRYDANENPNLTILPEQNRIERIYDERDLLFEQTRGAGSADAATWTYNYDRNRNLTEIIDAEDTDGDGAREKWTTLYDGFDRPVEEIDVICCNQTLTTYDPASNPTRILYFGHPAGGGSNVLLAETVQKYDELSRMFERGRKIFPDSGGAPAGPVTLTDGPTGDPGFAATQFFYDRNNRTFKTIDEEGDVTLTFFDGVDRPVRRVDAEGNEVLTEYDGNHNPIQTTEIERQPEKLSADENFITIRVYDELDRRIEVQDPLKHTRRTKYDSRSNVVFTSDAKDGGTPDGTVNSPGNTTEMFYDGINRLLRTARHLRVGGVGEAGFDTSNPFNPDGIVSTSQTWDGNTRLTSQTDDNGNTTTYVYNERDIKIQEIFADGTTNTYVRDFDDNVKTFTDENGSVFTYTYDGLNRRVSCTIQRAPGVVGTTQQTWIYDGLSRLRGHTDNNDPRDATDDAVCEIMVDSLSRVIEERLNGRLTNSSWFGENQRVGLVYPGGRQIAVAFDKLDRIQSISDGPPFVRLASYNYIGPWRVLRRTYGNGTVLDIGYDADRRITSYQHVDSFGQLLVGFNYRYDREHNRTSELRIHEGDGDTYSYDSLYRVVSAGFDQTDLSNPNTAEFEAFYTLDGVHNWREFARTEEGETLFDVQNTVNEMNEYVGFGNTEEEHDENGNLTKQTIFDEDGEIEVIRRFFWDALNRLLFVTEQEEGEEPEEVIARYGYYADGRRSFKIVFRGEDDDDDDDGPGPDARITEFFYDGWRIIEEQDASGQTEATYVQGPMYIDEHIAMDRAGERLFYHANALFNVHGLTDENGELVEVVRYDIYGQPFINADEVDFEEEAVNDEPPEPSPRGNPYLFTGHRFDPETGLYWMRHRYYDHSTGRFVQRDLIGYYDSLNLYQYVGNNPVNRYDPSGCQQGAASGPPTVNDIPQFVSSMNSAEAHAAQVMWNASKDNPVITEDIKCRVALYAAARKRGIVLDRRAVKRYCADLVYVLILKNFIIKGIGPPALKALEGGIKIYQELEGGIGGIRGAGRGAVKGTLKETDPLKPPAKFVKKKLKEDCDNE